MKRLTIFFLCTFIAVLFVFTATFGSVNADSSSSGWQQTDGVWYYYNSDGRKVTGFCDIDGKTYFFDESGEMVTGWKEIDGVWYYFRSSGAGAKGWEKIDGKWYYFNADCQMITGWQKISGQWYYFASTGAMRTGWQKIDNVWYYLNDNGRMLTGWQQIEGKWYYLTSSGAAVKGWKNISGKWYYFDSTYVMQTGMLVLSDGRYLLSTGGAMQTGWQQVEDSWYYFDSNGRGVTGLKDISGKTYYFNADGVMQTGQVDLDGMRYYFSDSGALIRSEDISSFIHMKFDLGGKGTASGYIGVSASDKYTADKGYGIYQTHLARNVDALGSGALSDAIHFGGGYGQLMVDLPAGVYKITVTTGNCQSVTINAEGVNQLYFLTGNNAVDSFTIPVTDGQLNIYATSGMGSVFSLCTVEIEQTSSGTVTKPTIWLCGDSTVATYYNVPDDYRRGWGQYLGRYVDTDRYDIRNISASGLRSSSLKASLFPTVEHYGKSGDILLLSVGINDYTDEWKAHPNAINPSSYISNMTAMVRSAKARGMTVYLVIQHGDYDDCSIYPLPDSKWFSEELKQIAASENVGIIDMFHPWLQFCLEITSRYSRNYYEINADGNVSIHPNAQGADLLAKIVADQLFPSGNSGYVDPQVTPAGTPTAVYKTVEAEETFTNPHKGYVMEVHNINMLSPGGHPRGIGGSMGNQAWNIISTCCSVLHWEDLNPAEGVYDWSAIDAMLEACDRTGYTYAIRIMPYSTGTGSDANFGEAHDFVPQWVYDKGAVRDIATYKYGDQSVKIKIPNWSDPIYNQAYMTFISALAERYDRDPRVEYIENRAYGNFGEWHTSEFIGNDMPSVEIQKAMLDHFAACFTHTECSVFNDARGEVGEYALSLGFARRNDGLVMGRNTEWELVPAYRANVPTMGDNHNTYAYMLNPPADTSYIRWTPERYTECVEIGHLTFFSIDQDSGCGYDIYREHQSLLDSTCKRLGYDFTVTYAARYGNKLVVKIKNIGLAPAFFNIDLCAEITDSNGNKIRDFGSPIRIGDGTFHDGEERTFIFEYNGSLNSSSTICLALYDADNPNAGSDPSVRFDNANTLENNRLKLVVE